MCRFPWKIISSRSIVRAVTLIAAGLLTGNILLTCYYFLGPSQTIPGTGDVQAKQFEHTSITKVNKSTEPGNVHPKLSGDDSIYSVVPPIDERSKFVHKIYWELVRRNATKVVSEPWVDLKSDHDKLKNIYDDGALWGDYRVRVPRYIVHGIAKKYDTHLILQQIWQQTALDIYPQLFQSNEVSLNPYCL